MISDPAHILQFTHSWTTSLDILLASCDYIAHLNNSASCKTGLWLLDGNELIQQIFFSNLNNSYSLMRGRKSYQICKNVQSQKLTLTFKLSIQPRTSCLSLLPKETNTFLLFCDAFNLFLDLLASVSHCTWTCGSYTPSGTLQHRHYCRNLSK